MIEFDEPWANIIPQAKKKKVGYRGLSSINYFSGANLSTHHSEKWWIWKNIFSSIFITSADYKTKVDSCWFSRVIFCFATFAEDNLFSFFSSHVPPHKYNIHARRENVWHERVKVYQTKNYFSLFQIQDKMQSSCLAHFFLFRKKW